MTTYSWEKKESAGSWVPFEGTPTAQNPTEDFDAGTWDIRVTATDGVQSNTKTRLAYVISSASSYTGPLDLVPGAVVAYGTRALSAARRGQNIFRLQEDGEDTEMDFAADSVTGAAPLAAIAAWLVLHGAENARVVTWYDQSGAGKDLLVIPGTNIFFIPELFGGKGGIRVGGGNADSSRYMATAGDVTLATGAYCNMLVIDYEGVVPQSKYISGINFLLLDDQNQGWFSGMGSSAADLDSTSDGFVTTELYVLSDPEEIPQFNTAGSRTVGFAWTYPEGNNILYINGSSHNLVESPGSSAVGSISGRLALGKNDALAADNTPGFSGSIAQYILYDGLKNAATILSVQANDTTFYSIS